MCRRTSDAATFPVTEERSQEPKEPVARFKSWTTAPGTLLNKIQKRTLGEKLAVVNIKHQTSKSKLKPGSPIA